MKTRENDLLDQLEMGEWKDKVAAAKQLGLSKSEELVSKLCTFLSHEDIKVGQASALALKAIGSDKSVPYLFEAFYSPQNKLDRSVFVYALKDLNCSRYFRQIFCMLFSSKILIRQSAMTIFMNNGFYMDDDDLICARNWFDDRKDLAVEFGYADSILERLSEFDK